MFAEYSVYLLMSNFNLQPAWIYFYTVLNVAFNRSFSAVQMNHSEVFNKIQSQVLITNYCLLQYDLQMYF